MLSSWATVCRPSQPYGSSGQNSRRLGRRRRRMRRGRHGRLSQQRNQRQTSHPQHLTVLRQVPAHKMLRPRHSHPERMRAQKCIRTLVPYPPLSRPRPESLSPPRLLHQMPHNRLLQQSRAVSRPRLLSSQPKGSNPLPCEEPRLTPWISKPEAPPRKSPGGSRWGLPRPRELLSQRSIRRDNVPAVPDLVPRQPRREASRLARTSLRRYPQALSMPLGVVRRSLGACRCLRRRGSLRPVCQNCAEARQTFTKARGLAPWSGHKSPGTHVVSGLTPPSHVAPGFP
mmetsp:Transcript_38089/g.107588  ORF Transcript_38089/g.107588 Transcript_38089/m.107588 type:complete len:285 (+) Transcript_38089:949-1803(+)